MVWNWRRSIGAQHSARLAANEVSQVRSRLRDFEAGHEQARLLEAAAAACDLVVELANDATLDQFMEHFSSYRPSWNQEREVSQLGFDPQVTEPFFAVLQDVLERTGMDARCATEVIADARDAIVPGPIPVGDWGTIHPLIDRLRDEVCGRYERLDDVQGRARIMKKLRGAALITAGAAIASIAIPIALPAGLVISAGAAGGFILDVAIKLLED
jgi:hypothetical protein